MVPSKVHGLESGVHGTIGRLLLRSLQYTVSTEPGKEKDRLEYEHLTVSGALISNIVVYTQTFTLHCHFAAENKSLSNFL